MNKNQTISVLDFDGVDRTGEKPSDVGFQRAMKCVAEHSLAISQPEFSRVFGARHMRRVTCPLYIPSGRYKITSPGVFSENMISNGVGFELRGDGMSQTEILFQPKEAGAMFDMDDGYLQSQVRDLSFGCDTTKGVFWKCQKKDASNSRRLRFCNVGWWGEWDKVFHLDAGNHNSEIEFDNTHGNLRGNTDCFMQVDGNDQQHGFHFRGGAWDLSCTMFRLNKGGKVKLQSMNFFMSDRKDLDGKPVDTKPFYVFECNGHSHYRSSMIVDIDDLRIEHISGNNEQPNGRLLKSEWGGGIIAIRNYNGANSAKRQPFENIVVDVCKGNCVGPIVDIQASELPGWMTVKSGARDYRRNSRIKIQTSTLVHRHWSEFIEYSQDDTRFRPAVFIDGSTRSKAMGKEIANQENDPMDVPGQF